MLSRSASAGVAIVAVLACLPATLRAQWDVEYYADSMVYPEDNGTGWSYYNSDNHFQRGFVDDTLWVNTMPPGDPWNALVWQNTTGTFDFQEGFVMEARLHLINATSDTQRWGGACIYARDAAGYNMSIDVDPDRVILGSIFEFVSFPMDTTDGFHTYRAEAFEDHGKLYVDGVLRLEMDLSKDNPDAFLMFGDQGWEGGEMYYEFVRYGPLDACPPDINGDGVVNTQDVLEFLNAWADGEPSADWNGDGTVDTRDFLAFLNDWVEGCP